MEDDRSTRTRRSFLDLALGGGFTALSAAVLYPVASYLIPPASGDPGARTITLDPTDPKQVDPETKVFVFGNKPGILVRGPDARGTCVSDSAHGNSEGRPPQTSEVTDRGGCSCEIGRTGSGFSSVLFLLLGLLGVTLKRRS